MYQYKVIADKYNRLDNKAGAYPSEFNIGRHRNWIRYVNRKNGTKPLQWTSKQYAHSNFWSVECKLVVFKKLLIIILFIK